MNDDRTLKFAVDGFCSSRTTYVYKNTVPTVGFYCLYTFFTHSQTLIHLQIWFKQNDSTFYCFKTYRLFKQLCVLMHKDT